MYDQYTGSPQLQLEKSKGEILGVVIVESGWGSILPTVILANMMNGGPAARSGKLSIGDQIMSINNTSLVGLPLATCQGIIKVQRHWSEGASNTLLFKRIVTYSIFEKMKKHLCWWFLCHCIKGLEEPGTGENEHSQLPPCYHCPH